MLAFFPRIYENELLYSVISRYHYFSGNLNIKDTTRDLFGKGKLNIIPDLPTDLNALIERVQHFSDKRLIDWLDQHTLYNYYTNFTNLKVKKHVLERMTESTGKHSLHHITGQVAGNVKEHVYFRYCPVCLKNDIEVYGETYWRTYHQLPSVFVCIEHSTFLRNSNMSYRQRKSSFAQPSLMNCTSINDSNPVTFPKMSFELLLKISMESYKITVTDYKFNQGMLFEIYRYLLGLKGYKNLNGTINQDKLKEDFILFYGKDYLRLMQSIPCGVEGKCWLKSITRKHRKSFHPVRHLLLINFFGESVDTVRYCLNKNANPFGEGPYLCLNPAASHYQKPVITELKISRCLTTKKPIATFYCTCGFIYSRKGPDIDQKDKQKIGRIKQFGDLWMKKLHYLVYEERLSYRACAKLLKVDTNTVIKYIKNQGSQSKKNDYLPSNNREQWLSLRNKYPSLSKTELRKVNPALYMVLYRNDKEWLNDNSPVIQRRKVHDERIDWSMRDYELLNEVKKAVQELNKSKKPVRITKSLIGKRIKRTTLLEKKITKLPLTMHYINSISESVEEYQKKRIKWAVKQLEKEELTISKICRKAGIKKCYYQDLKEDINKYINEHQ